MMRAFNAREGLGRKDDRLPKKFYKALQGTGPTGGTSIDPGAFEDVLDLYYQMMGWTPEGTPTRAKMIDLGVEWIANYVPQIQ